MDRIPGRAAARRSARATRPTSRRPLRGSLRLSDRREAAGSSRFSRPRSATSARAGEPIVYAGRNQRARQDWLRFPVAGIAPADVERYLRWLRDTGRVPGARLCTELEWERAARGADDRLYPHGDDLAPDDANFDVTYGRVDCGVRAGRGRRAPASRSPFGVDDMAGNVFELVPSSQKPDEFVDSRGRLLLQLRDLPPHQPQRGAVDVSRRDHRNSRLRIGRGDMP